MAWQKGERGGPATRPPHTGATGLPLVQSSTGSAGAPGATTVSLNNRPSAVALRRAGPLAFAGVAANAANVIVTVTIAHLLSSRDYGSLGQLLVLFLLLSMPGSALLVAVVHRVTAWSMGGQAERIKPWVAKMRRSGIVGLVLLAALAWLSRSGLASLLSLPNPDGLGEFLIAGGGRSQPGRLVGPTGRPCRRCSSRRCPRSGSPGPPPRRRSVCGPPGPVLPRLPAGARRRDRRT